MCSSDLLTRRIAILDGAMGTMVQREHLDEAAVRGARFRDHGHSLRNNIDLLVLTRPDLISAIHHAYLDAGADIIETNTFSSTSVAQADFGLSAAVHELNVAAARLARDAADAWTTRTPERPRFVAHGCARPRQHRSGRSRRPRGSHPAGSVTGPRPISAAAPRVAS